MVCCSVTATGIVSAPSSSFTSLYQPIVTSRELKGQGGVDGMFSASAPTGHAIADRGDWDEGISLPERPDRRS
jgi:hypothetical protein